MTQTFMITRFLIVSSIFLAAFFLFGYWLRTGQFWQNTREIDWLVYFLIADRLMDRKKDDNKSK